MVVSQFHAHQKLQEDSNANEGVDVIVVWANCLGFLWAQTWEKCSTLTVLGTGTLIFLVVPRND